MNILAIDPGTNLGWARWCDGIITSGVSDLKPRSHEGSGMRFVRLGRVLRELEIERMELVAFEEVRSHRGAHAAHVYGGIIGHIQSMCEARHIPYEAVPVGEIKRHATGKGNASKPLMLRTARGRWGDGVESADEADALWILDLVRSRETPNI